MQQVIEGCIVSTAASLDEIRDNITKNLKLELAEAHLSRDWRANKPIAIVGGGPSLKDTIHELKDYQSVMVCGSAHDYVVRNSGCAIDYAVICDPDPLVLNYLTEVREYTTYYVASQCSPEVFEYLKKQNVRVKIWHAAGDKFDNTIFGENKQYVGGGCTVGTRAMFMALAFGFNNLHLYGFDTCLTNDYGHHAYGFSTETETVGDIREIKLDIPNSPTFKVAGYMLAQLFDFRKMCEMYSTRMAITVHGDGLLKTLVDYSKQAGVIQNAN